MDPTRPLVEKYIRPANEQLWRIRRFVPDRIRHNMSLAEDITYGWGPGNPSWKRNETSFLMWFDKWYWNGRCSNCYGEGVLHFEYPEEKDVSCAKCEGTGKRG